MPSPLASGDPHHEWIVPWREQVCAIGQGLAECAPILALIAIVALIFLGGKVSAILSAVGKSI